MAILDIYIYAKNKKLIFTSKEKKTALSNFFHTDEEDSFLKSFTIQTALKHRAFPRHHKNKFYYGLTDADSGKNYFFTCDKKISYANQILEKIKEVAETNDGINLQKNIEEIKIYPELFKIKNAVVNLQNYDTALYEQQLNNFIDNKINYFKTCKEKNCQKKFLELKRIQEEIQQTANDYNDLNTQTENCCKVLALHHHTGFAGFIRCNFMRKTNSQSELEQLVKQIEQSKHKL